MQRLPSILPLACRKHCPGFLYMQARLHYQRGHLRRLFSRHIPVQRRLQYLPASHTFARRKFCNYSVHLQSRLHRHRHRHRQQLHGMRRRKIQTLTWFCPVHHVHGGMVLGSNCCHRFVVLALQFGLVCGRGITSLHTMPSKLASSFDQWLCRRLPLQSRLHRQ